jgi:hypothetical protein
MKRSKAVLNDLAADYRNAPIEERNYQYRDVFTRQYEQVSVELCQGRVADLPQGFGRLPGHHPSREAAKAAALAMLGL